VERQGPHTPLKNIYLSSWLDGLNDHHAEKREGKKEKRSLREKKVRGWRKFFMCQREKEQKEGEK